MLWIQDYEATKTPERYGEPRPFCFARVMAHHKAMCLFKRYKKGSGWETADVIGVEQEFQK